MTRGATTVEGRQSAPSLGALGLLSFTLSALSPAASVFITGAGVLRIAGTGAGIAIVLGALLAVVAAVQYAEVADALPHAGGLYPGVKRLLGGWASFVIVVLSVLAAPAFLAFSALGLADYLGVLVPALPRLPTAAAAVVAASALALLRLRHSTRLAGVFLLLEVGAVLALTGIALFLSGHGGGVARLTPMTVNAAGMLAPTPLWQMVLATVAGAWACSGALWGTYMGEDVRRRGASFGTTLAMSGVVGALLVCAPILAVSLSMDDPAHILSSPAPLASFIAEHAGPAVGRAMSLAVVLAIFNNLMTMTMGLARLLFATARDGLWPRPLTHLLTRAPQFGSPLGATVLLTSLALPCVLLSERFLLIVLSAELVSPLLIVLAVLLGRRTLRDGSSYRSPFYPFLSLVGLASIALFATADWLDTTAGRPGMILLVVIVLLASLWYLVRRPARRLARDSAAD